MQFVQFSKIATRQEIDTANAVIKGVSVITKGEAEGHDLLIDGTTLEQVEEASKKFSGGLKVRFNHPIKGKDASVLSTAGVLKNFRRDGDCLRADLHLLKTEADTPKILEMASLMPESFGLSVVFSGKDEKKDGKTFARCTEIYACDLVDDPAANPTGLFSTNNHQESMSDKFKTLLSKLFGKDPEQATEAEIAEIDKQLSMKKCSKCGKAHGEKETCMSNDKDEDDKKMAKAIQDALAPVVTKLAVIEGDRNEQVALAKKAEIDGLISEASKDGRVLPLDTADIYEQKDGKTTIKMEPSMLRKMIEKLPKAQVQLSRRTVPQPKSEDGKTAFARGSEEWKDFYRTQRERGAEELTRKFQNIN